ncbi:MAG: hypothetical protein J6Z41_07475 [Prevotella sp.]|nr:hypothetical protein [Prevotella sp.]
MTAETILAGLSEPTSMPVYNEQDDDTEDDFDNLLSRQNNTSTWDED